MKTLLSPKWILLLHTLPVIVLSILYRRDYLVIKSLLSEEQKAFWLDYGILLSCLTIADAAYAIIAVRRRKLILLSYSFISFLLHLSFVYFSLYNTESLFPSGLPQWMVSSTASLYTGTFLMPAMVHTLLLIVIYCTRHVQKRNPWLNFGAAILIPVIAYIFIQVILPTWNYETARNHFAVHVLNIIYIALVILLLFFLFRFLYILLNKKGKWFLTTRLIWIILIGIVLPVTGLSVNEKNGNFFGDFTHPWFYILAIFNGLLLCLPEKRNRYCQLLLFSGRCLTLCYTIYFFFVFLPLLPLSVAAIVLYGAGFLMLTPVALFCIHIHKLTVSYQQLRKQFACLTYPGLAAGLIIPVLLFSSYVSDRINLHQALEYVYTPDASKKYSINRKALSTTLDVIRQSSSRTGRSITNERQPYLSAIYTWAVLDNLSLSEDKSKRLRQVFNGDSITVTTPVIAGDSTVKLTSLDATSRYSPDAAAWLSTVTIELTNTSAATGEYGTSFRLPAGCFVSDYFLYIGNRKEQGTLAEKRTAQWIFNQIRNEKRDPGILYYKNPEELSLKVFPFAAKEIRKTGIQFLHKDPVTIRIDGRTVRLGRPIKSTDTSPATGPVYLSPAEKKKLPTVYRKPYYHFLVDASAAAVSNAAQQEAVLDHLIKTLGTQTSEGQISFVSSQVHTVRVSDQWQQAFHRVRKEGGFFLERALQENLIRSYLYDKGRYPVFVVVTNHFEQAVLDSERKGLSFTFPEGGSYFVASGSGNIRSFTLSDNRPDTTVTGIHCNPVAVFAYPDAIKPAAYLNTDSAAAILIKEDYPTPRTQYKRDWTSALALYANAQAALLHQALKKEGWKTDLKNSFQSGILTANTAYMVVENEAQKAMLYRKQKEVMDGNRNLDVDNETTSMSEPGYLLWIILLLLLIKNGNCLRRAAAVQALKIKRWL
ncbi:MSEP-CTERM sorting domain-containing protein [Niabella beijingensis]|uniref:MSEP-CTERM sorting domain-containing protein n=1 Tax=Niabella beijingensis TaxID=2872700 RepID=UPI001CBAE316|nr:MSEP-CTERM sorting domain-containing protein [Niabella beijingensis]MBZ4190185.1 MSEP-CTERM sorting domain-containing protein [Niabella beijingensis]